MKFSHTQFQIKISSKDIHKYLRLMHTYLHGCGSSVKAKLKIVSWVRDLLDVDVSHVFSFSNKITY